ncbi:tRNA 2-selenouridine(34) synthase MnmH [Scopulibacillus cellulosilyticus]|uniref:tRNA 2-selenouridine(34) synthase MnmH n=1 Tax=Scopulibacillus cellulosilyticus TaxID=2665665 RepID=A0ABW2PWA2_9BACL
MDSVKKISISELLEKKEQTALIDVRSPGEFKEFHIPGAVNVPLFSNDERAMIGTLYKQKGPHIAKAKGLEIVSPKLPKMYEKIKSQADEKEHTVIYCWRGGMRSRSIASVMCLMGVYSFQLEGGIRSFRKRIVEELEHLSEVKKPFVVLEGLTGTRKTDILSALQEKGYPVLDLEGMAGHRGSIFGSVGLEPHSQKEFECLLWQRLIQLKDAPYYIIEAESKRIGRIVLPQFIVEGKEEGQRFHINYPFQKRVAAIYDAYNPEQHEEAVYEAFTYLKKYLQPAFAEEIEQAYNEKDYFRVISLFLEHYYDPKYSHKFKKYKTEAIPLVISSVNEGVEKIEQMLNNYKREIKKGV